LGQIEVDEAYLGGKWKNRHINAQTGKRQIPDKTAVLGILQWGGKVVTSVIPNASAMEVLPRIRKHVTPRSTVFTDEARVYRTLPQLGYQHKRVYHSAFIYVDGEASTNSLESFWSIAKNGIRGSNRHVGSHYLQDYLNAYAFRWNRRRNPASMFDEISLRLPASKPTPTVRQRPEEPSRNQPE
jgi:transposase-like protein